MNSDLFRAILDWWWLAPLVGVAAVAYKFLGWRGLLAVLTLGLAKGIYTKGREAERERLQRMREAERLAAKEDRDYIDAKVKELDPDGLRNELGKWVRDDPRDR